MTLVHSETFVNFRIRLGIHMRNFFSIPFRDLAGFKTAQEIQLFPITFRRAQYEDPWHSLFNEIQPDFKQFAGDWTGDSLVKCYGTVSLVVMADPGQITMVAMLSCEKDEEGNRDNVTSISVPFLIFDLEACSPLAENAL